MLGTGKFRINAKGWFLTYPKCSLSKEDAMEALKQKRKGLKQIIVSRELHTDGEPHLHCYLYYERPFDCTNERFFDLEGFHPNLQAAKSLRAVQGYIKKDGDFIQEGINYKAELSAITDHTSVLCKRLIDGESVEELVRENPTLVRGFKKLIEDVHVFRNYCAPKLSRCSGFIPNTFGLNMPLMSTKQSHYWLWSESPNKGKTTFLKAIQAQYPSLWYSWTEKYQQAAPYAQFVLLDEYSIGHLTIMTLNSMCDRTFQYPVKGSSPFALPDSTLLVCGNRSPLDIYDSRHHELIKARFIVHCLDV